MKILTYDAHPDKMLENENMQYVSLNKLLEKSDVISLHCPLLSAKNCIITPHIAWAPYESRKRLLDIAVQNLADFICGKPSNRIN